MKRLFSVFSRVSKPKDTSDSSESSNGNQNSRRDLTRWEYERRQQEASSSQRSETSSSQRSEAADHFSPTADRRRQQEISSSYHSEAADLQRLLAERQRQETSSSDRPETSDHSFADFHPSQQWVELKNSRKVLARDIPPIMKSLQNMAQELDNMVLLGRVAALSSNNEVGDYIDFGKMTRLVLASTDLKRMCINPSYYPGSNTHETLQDAKLIDGEGHLSDSVKNIVLSLDGKYLDNSPVAEHVILRNGTEESPALVKTAMSILRTLREEKPIALSELYKLCKDQNHPLDEETTKVLKSRNLIDSGSLGEDDAHPHKRAKLDKNGGSVESLDLSHPPRETYYHLINKNTGKLPKAIENIVLSSFDEQSGELRSPAISYDELKKKLIEPLFELHRESKRVKELESEINNHKADHDLMGILDIHSTAKTILQEKQESIENKRQKLKEIFQKDKEVLQYIYPNQSDNY